MLIEDVIDKLHPTPRLLRRWVEWLDRLQITDTQQSIALYRRKITLELSRWATADSPGMQSMLLRVMDIEQTSPDCTWIRNLNDIVIPYLQSYVEPLLCPIEHK